MLGLLVGLALIASAAHFGHNALFLATYPGPPWISGPWFVVVAWVVLAAVLLLGFGWYRRGRRLTGGIAMGVYCLSCLLVFGHYLYGPPAGLSVAANVLIFSEGVAGALLGGYLIGQLARTTP